MSKYYNNGESSMEIWHGDEHYCFGKCEGDRWGNCNCAAVNEHYYREELAKEFQEWLVKEGQDSSC